jgi:uncharacterized membrane protein
VARRNDDLSICNREVKEMKKNEFLVKLMHGLSSLPQEEIEERIAFYNEMIDDRMEEGLTEEEAIASLGSVESIIDQIIVETPLASLIKAKIKRTHKLSAWEITLLAIGAPIWVSIIAAVFAVLFTVYASIWAVVVSLWAVFSALAGASVGGILGGILFLCLGKAPAGFGLISAALVCGGLAILMFYACKYTTIAMAWLTKKIALVFKKCFTKKEEK